MCALQILQCQYSHKVNGICFHKYLIDNMYQCLIRLVHWFAGNIVQILMFASFNDTARAN